MHDAVVSRRCLTVTVTKPQEPTRGVHGNGEDWDPMGFPWDSHGNGSKISHGMGMGIKCMGMGVKTWELSPATVNSLLFLHSNME